MIEYVKAIFFRVRSFGFQTLSKKYFLISLLRRVCVGLKQKALIYILPCVLRHKSAENFAKVDLSRKSWVAPDKVPPSVAHRIRVPFIFAHHIC